MFPTSGVFRGQGAFGNIPARVDTLIFYEKSTGPVHERLMRGRHINFKTVLHSESEHAIFFLKTKKISGEGGVWAPPQMPPSVGGKTPPAPCRHLKPSAPLSKILNMPLFLTNHLAGTSKQNYNTKP